MVIFLFWGVKVLSVNNWLIYGIGFFNLICNVLLFNVLIFNCFIGFLLVLILFVFLMFFIMYVNLEFVLGLIVFF